MTGEGDPVSLGRAAVLAAVRTLLDGTRAASEAQDAGDEQTADVLALRAVSSAMDTIGRPPLGIKLLRCSAPRSVC